MIQIFDPWSERHFNIPWYVCDTLEHLPLSLATYAIMVYGEIFSTGFYRRYETFHYDLGFEIDNDWFPIY